ncbi:MAG: hypothetical protein QG567_1236 [Campylobacterota bacterium]|nr:hypothetical protein [Campylobacterota bacterium]
MAAWGYESATYSVRCVRDSKNFDTLSFSSFLELFKTSNSTQESIMLFTPHSRVSESQLFLVQKDGQNYFGTKNELEKQLTEYSKNPFETIQKLTQSRVDAYLSDLASQIPKEIQKPVLPKAPELTKGEFEKKADFEIRVQGAMAEREKQITALQEQYRKDVEARNKTIENLKVEQKRKKENLPKKVEEFSKVAFIEVMKGVKITDAKYDVENEIMYLKIAATNADFSKKASFKMAPMEAKNFKENLDTQWAAMEFGYENEGFVLKNIEVASTKEVTKKNEMVYEKDKIFTATLTDIDFKPQTIKVALSDKKVEFDNQAEAKLTIQNPNLVDSYQVSALGYGESSQAKGKKYNDDIPELLTKIQPAAIDKKKWLFVVGIEDYTETDKIAFAKRSAESFAKVAQKTLGVSDRNTYALIDSKATAGSIKDKLNLLLNEVKEGDTIYFYYNGHGIPDVAKGGEPYMLPSDKIPDFITKEDEFSLKQIYKKLGDSKADKVIAVVDSCFSGATDGIAQIKGVAATRVKPKAVTFDQTKMVVLSAGKDTQYSNMYEDKGHRLFSYFVMKSLLGGKKTITELFREVSYKTSEASNELGALKKQEPTMQGNDKLEL